MSYTIDDARDEMQQEAMHEYKFFIAKRRRRRLYLAMGCLITSALFPMVLIFVTRAKQNLDLMGSFPIFAGALCSIALGGAALIYLRPSSSRIETSNNVDMRSYIDFRMEEIFNSLQSRSKETEKNDRQKAIELLKSRLESEAISGVIDKIKSEIATALRKEGLDGKFQVTQKRLGQEVQDLARRGNLNLVLGIFMAAAGLCTLTYTVASSPVTTSITEILSHFLPRISLTLLIELFAYFFLRLYKQTLQEIKYFQNEITNIESRAAAAYVAFDSGDAKLIEKVTFVLTDTERNFVLQKDQTTVELERDRIANKGDSKAIFLITEALRGLSIKG